MENHMHDDYSEGRMTLPNPMATQSGWSAQPNNTGYAMAVGPATGPEGMVYVPEMGTYVEPDIAAAMGFGGASPGMTPADSADGPKGIDPTEAVDPTDYEISDDDLEALQAELDTRPQGEPSLSPTAEAIAHTLGSSLDRSVERMIEGTNEETLSMLTEATGVDADTAVSLISSAVEEVTPVARENIGADRWASLLYAASATPDPFARRVVTEFALGKLQAHKLGRAYDLWYQSLPDADPE